MLVEAKWSAIKGDGGGLGLRATVARGEVDGECVSCRLLAVVGLVGERDSSARRG